MHIQPQQSIGPVRARPWARGPRRQMALMVALVGLWAPAQAATFTCSGGDVACLIAAITRANANGEANTIHLGVGTYRLTAQNNRDPDGRSAPNGLPLITSDLTIIGETLTVDSPFVPPQRHGVTIRRAGAQDFRLLRVGATGRLRLDHLILEGGDLGWIDNGDGSGHGGAIWNDGRLEISTSLLRGNRGTGGGAIWNTGHLILRMTTIRDNDGTRTGSGIGNQGTLTIERSTLVANQAFDGGGLFNKHGATADLADSTLARNRAVGWGGGVHSYGVARLRNCTLAENEVTGGGGEGGGLSTLKASGTTQLQNTLLANNRAPRGWDCAGHWESPGHNFVGTLRGCGVSLRPADINGGFTDGYGLDAFRDGEQPGHGHVPLLAWSPAIDAGDPAVCAATDQLGQRRAQACDIGAVEFHAPPSGMVRRHEWPRNIDGHVLWPVGDKEEGLGN
jgi:hypothetical protein